MSIKHYQALQQKSEEQKGFLGVKLPQLQQGNLDIVTSDYAFEQVVVMVNDLKPTQGWLMYRDGVEYTLNAPSRIDFIEGEWCNDKASIKVKFIGEERYLVTHMSQNSGLNESENSMCFKEQLTYLAKGNDVNNCARYFQWYKLGTDHANQGCWLPLAQQFVGFTQDKKESA
jgi:hypothetical protein